MRTSRKRLAVMAGILSLTLLAAACGGDDTNAGNGGGSSAAGLTGTITASGSSTVQPITSLVAELFSEQNPDVKVSVDGPGTSDGFVLFCDGETDLQDASRAIEPEEIKACKKNGIDYVELEVALDGLTVMTNGQNSAVECLNFGDLYCAVRSRVRGLPELVGRQRARGQGRRQRRLPERAARDHGPR